MTCLSSIAQTSIKPYGQTYLPNIARTSNNNRQTFLAFGLDNIWVELFAQCCSDKHKAYGQTCLTKIAQTVAKRLKRHVCPTLLRQAQSIWTDMPRRRERFSLRHGRHPCINHPGTCTANMRNLNLQKNWLQLQILDGKTRTYLPLSSNEEMKKLCFFTHGFY